MSSDSDDLDEDELLQMALKEPSQRNTSYGAIAHKPGANYVQPPKTTRPNNPPNSNNSSRATTASGGGESSASGKGSSGRRSMDDDEDLDVEMLSISSGDDEDDSIRDKAVGEGAGGAVEEGGDGVVLGRMIGALGMGRNLVVGSMSTRPSLLEGFEIYGKQDLWL